MSRPPDRYKHTVVPHIYIDGAEAAIAFYRAAFGAVEMFRIDGPDGRIVHAELSMCGATVMLGDPTDPSLYADPRTLGHTTAGLHLFVDDAAAVQDRAVAAGAEAIQPPADLFYGARSASVRDPFGHVWVLLTWLEDLSTQEIERRGRQAAGDQPVSGQ
jgi:PhnB protein